MQKNIFLLKSYTKFHPNLTKDIILNGLYWLISSAEFIEILAELIMNYFQNEVHTPYFGLPKSSDLFLFLQLCFLYHHPP
jgi:hypothetical protein